VIKQNNNLDLYTSQRDNLGIDEEGPDISNASIEQINKSIEDFIETFGLPIEMNGSLI
jgi:hypothetical protein